MASRSAGVAGRQGAVQLHGDPRGFQAADRPIDPGEDTLRAAESFIRGIRRAVQSKVVPVGGSSCAFGGLVVNERPVGVDGNEETHVDQRVVQLPEIRPEEGFAAGEQKIQ